MSRHRNLHNLDEDDYYEDYDDGYYDEDGGEQLKTSVSPSPMFLYNNT